MEPCSLAAQPTIDTQSMGIPRRLLQPLMATIETIQFGTLEYDESDVFLFAGGLPGFEGTRRFICVEQPALRPLVFLQNVDDPAVCFTTLPPRLIDPGYVLNLAGDDIEGLGLIAADQSLACLAIICMLEDGTATANLLGPVVISRETMRGIQAVRPDTMYSAVHALRLMKGRQDSGDGNAPGELRANHSA